MESGVFKATTEVAMVDPGPSNLPPPWWLGHPCPRFYSSMPCQPGDAYQMAEASKTLELLLK